MNWARGLFRLWIVLSALWIAAAILLEWLPDAEWYADQVQRVDLTASDVTATENADGSYTVEADGRSYIIEITGGTLADTAARHRMLESVAQEFNEDAKQANADLQERRRRAQWSAARLALLPPLFIFILGGSLVWALRGFRRSSA